MPSNQRGLTLNNAPSIPGLATVSQPIADLMADYDALPKRLRNELKTTRVDWAAYGLRSTAKRLGMRCVIDALRDEDRKVWRRIMLAELGEVPGECARKASQEART